MYLLSAQAREMIDEAVNALSDPAQRHIWQSWAERYPRLLLPDGPVPDDEPSMPADVTVVVLTALREMETTRRNRRRADPEISEDDRADLDNEITYIGAVTRLVQEAARV
jgi:hypothetical protein